jgi:glycosyltransferase involved in cell wall biosynthesis
VLLLDWLSRRRDTTGLLRPVGDDFTTASGVGLMRDPKVRTFVEKYLPVAPAVVALSRQMVEDSIALGVPAGRIHEIPNAVDQARFQIPHDRAETRRKHGLDPAKPLFLSVGRAHPQKNYPVMFDAFRRLIDNGAPAFQSAIVGRESAKLQPEVERRGLGGIVHLMEVSAAPSAGHYRLPADEMVALYQAADVFVMPSVLEGFSSAMLEASAAALPIVTTDGPGCRDFIRDGRDGIMVPVGDSSALADALRLLLANPEERSGRAEAALARAQDFSWDNTVGRYLSLYRSLIANHQV